MTLSVYEVKAHCTFEDDSVHDFLLGRSVDLLEVKEVMDKLGESEDLDKVYKMIHCLYKPMVKTIECYVTRDDHKCEWFFDTPYEIDDLYPTQGRISGLEWTFEA